MWLLYIFATLLSGLEDCQGLPTFTELKPADTYEVKIDSPNATVTFVNPHSDKPVLREIVFYHLTEKAYNGEVKQDVTARFDSLDTPKLTDPYTSRMFTNGHGNYDKEVSAAKKQSNDTAGHQEPNEIDTSISTATSFIDNKNTDAKTDETENNSNESKIVQTTENLLNIDEELGVEDEDVIEEPIKVADNDEEPITEDSNHREKRSLKESPLDHLWHTLPQTAQKIMSENSDILDAKKVAELIYKNIPETKRGSDEKPFLKQSYDYGHPESPFKAEMKKRIQNILSSFKTSGQRKTYGMALAAGHGIVWNTNWGDLGTVAYGDAIHNIFPGSAENTDAEPEDTEPEEISGENEDDVESAENSDENHDILVNIDKEESTGGQSSVASGASDNNPPATVNPIPEDTNVKPEVPIASEINVSETTNETDEDPDIFVNVNKEETTTEHPITAPPETTTTDTEIVDVTDGATELEEQSDELKMETLLSNEKFWTWLGDWTSTFMNLMDKHIQELVKQEVALEIDEIKKDVQKQIVDSIQDIRAVENVGNQNITETNESNIKEETINDIDKIMKLKNITENDVSNSNGIKVVSLATSEDKNIFIVFTDNEKDEVIEKLTSSSKLNKENFKKDEEKLLESILDKSGDENKLKTEETTTSNATATNSSTGSTDSKPDSSDVQQENDISLFSRLGLEKESTENPISKNKNNIDRQNAVSEIITSGKNVSSIKETSNEEITDSIKSLSETKTPESVIANNNNNEQKTELNVTQKASSDVIVIPEKNINRNDEDSSNKETKSDENSSKSNEIKNDVETTTRKHIKTEENEISEAIEVAKINNIEVKQKNVKDTPKEKFIDNIELNSETKTTKKTDKAKENNNEKKTDNNIAPTDPSDEIHIPVPEKKVNSNNDDSTDKFSKIEENSSKPNKIKNDVETTTSKLIESEKSDKIKMPEALVAPKTDNADVKQDNGKNTSNGKIIDNIKSNGEIKTTKKTDKAKENNNELKTEHITVLSDEKQIPSSKKNVNSNDDDSTDVVTKVEENTTKEIENKVENTTIQQVKAERNKENKISENITEAPRAATKTDNSEVHKEIKKDSIESSTQTESTVQNEESTEAIKEDTNSPKKESFRNQAEAIEDKATKVENQTTILENEGTKLEQKTTELENEATKLENQETNFEKQVTKLENDSSTLENEVTNGKA